MNENMTAQDKSHDPLVEDDVFRQIFALAPLANILVDRDCNIWAWNRRAEAVLKKSGELTCGCGLAGFVRLTDRDLLQNTIKQSCDFPFEGDRDLQLQSISGEIWLIRINGLSSANNEKKLFYMTLFDISGDKDANSLCDLVAWHDPLTGLPNRKLLFDRLHYSLRDASRRQEKLALLFIDCDNFKRINDSQGHDVGDMVLQQIAQNMKECLRENDTLARMGGDEFMVLMQHIDNINDVLLVAQRLLEAVGRPMEIRGSQIIVSASIGICLSPDDGKTPGTLVRNADLAMYQAKEHGRNRYVLFNESLRQAAGKREQLARQLQKAIENRELEMHYQPLLSVNGKQILAVEALLRWRKNATGWVTAGQFLPLAESLDLGQSFYDWAIEQACCQMGTWIRNGLLAENEQCRMAINLDSSQLQTEKFSSYLREIMERYGLKGNNLAFEVKEADIRAADAVVEKNIKQLIALGGEIYLDDFNQGFCSLFRLSSISYTWVKIDQAFTELLLSNKIGRTLLTTMIEVAHNLGIKVLAEGIESAENLDWLQKNLCDGLQGFYFCQPMTAVQMELLLAHRFTKL